MSSAKHYGQADTTTIRTGINLVVDLKNADHGIEAERLLTKLASSCRRVHGPDHQLTQRVESKLQKYKAREVRIDFGGEKRFQALRYTEDGNKCIVQGPIVNPRNTQEEKQITVASSSIFVTLGTPVVCHGLKQSAHLNGKIGDIRAHNSDIDRYEVHFEDKVLEPCLVKRGNIRIIFELPDEL